jgi:hypothetical protein
MSLGTALIILAIVGLALRSETFRTFMLILVGLGLGGLAFLIDFGSDKPQTIFYRSSAHPAFMMQTGDTCPPERHVWNGWCVK